MKLSLIAATTMLLACSAASAATIECRDKRSDHLLTCEVVEAEHNRGRAPEHHTSAPNTPDTPSTPDPTVNRPDGPTLGGDPTTPTDPTDPGCTSNCGGGDPDPDPGCTGVCGGPDDPSRHRNNGWGNGDQDAPGNSQDHNNAENNHKGKTDPSHGKNNK